VTAIGKPVGKLEHVLDATNRFRGERRQYKIKVTHSIDGFFLRISRASAKGNAFLFGVSFALCVSTAQPFCVNLKRNKPTLRMAQRVLAVVVLYFPEKEISKIIDFKGEVDDVMIIDNTQNNIGVAAALNKALDRAIKENYDWLLTMDQDSVFEPGSLKILREFAFTCKENIAIVSPFHFIKKPLTKTSVEEVKITMTSGNLLRVSAAKTAGSFDEKLFIDSVDNEYCLRLRKNGFKIVRVNAAILHHQLGKLGPFGIVTHPATRRYYITRNMLYVMSRYFPQLFLFGSKELIKSFVLILLVEDDKANKLRSMYRGMIDWTKISR
jgi:rhamnosyltransferase